MAVLDEKISLGLVLKVKKDGKIIEVPVSDLVEMNKIDIQSEADLQVLVDNAEEFILNTEDSFINKVITTLSNTSSHVSDADDTPASSALKKR